MALRGAYVLRSSPHVVEERRPLGVFRSSPHAVGKKVQHVLTNFHSQQRRSESGGAPQRHKKQGLGFAHLGLSSITCFFCLPGPATNNHPNDHRTSNKDKSAAHDTLGSGHSQRETPNPQPNNTQATLTKRVVGCSPTGLARGQSRRTNCPSTATSGALCSPAPIQYHKLRVAKVTSHCTSPQVQRRPSRNPSKNRF